MAEQTEQLHYLPVRILRPTGVRAGAPGDADLAIINERFAAEPLAADSINVPPRLAPNNPAHGCRINTEPQSQGTLSRAVCILLANVTNRFVGQSSHSASLPARKSFGMLTGSVAFAINTAACAPPLLRHISEVICGRAKKEMRGVDAGSHVAAMTDEQPIRDWPIGKLKGDAVCLPYIALLDAERTVPVTSTTRPHPAVTGHINIGPETIGDRLSRILSGHFLNLLCRFRGAMPPAVHSGAGAFACPNYSMGMR